MGSSSSRSQFQPGALLPCREINLDSGLNERGTLRRGRKKYPLDVSLRNESWRVSLAPSLSQRCYSPEKLVYGGSVFESLIVCSGLRLSMHVMPRTKISAFLLGVCLFGVCRPIVNCRFSACYNYRTSQRFNQLAGCIWNIL